MTARLSRTFVGALQGLALWLLYRSWATAHPVPQGTLLSFVVASGLVVHFVSTGRDGGRLVAMAVLTGVLFGSIAAWVGGQLPPSGQPGLGDEQRVETWSFVGLLALYYAGPFLQIFQATGRARFPYGQLYLHAWTNFFVGALGATFTIALWIVLVLWGQLFKLVDIDFFAKLFAQPLFIFVTTGAAVGYGLALGRESEPTTSAARGLTQLLFRTLLPLLAAVTLTFLATLAATGVARLYATGHAAWIVFGWVAGYLVLFNAVYQDGSGRRPYGLIVRRTVEAAAFAMPILAAIGLHALWLRIGQHGLTPSRMWGAVGGAILSLYAVGYAAAVPWRTERWISGAARVNTAMAIVVVLVALAMHTPLLDPLSWSARDQVRRLEAGIVSPADFDFGFLRFHLGHVGASALDHLEASASPPDADLVREAVTAVRTVDQESEWRSHLASRFYVDRFERRPDGTAWPEGLLDAIARESHADALAQCGRTETCIVFDFDLDADGTPEALVLAGRDKPLWPEVSVFQRGETGWHLVGSLHPEHPADSPGPGQALAAVREGRIEIAEPRYRDLLLGGERFRLLKNY